MELVPGYGKCFFWKGHEGKVSHKMIPENHYGIAIALVKPKSGALADGRASRASDYLDISTGMVMDSSRTWVTPPKIRSMMREVP